MEIRIAELEQLLWQQRDGLIDTAGLARIDLLVTGDADVRQFYIRYSMLCGGLRWLNLGANEERRTRNEELTEENDECGMMNAERLGGLSEEWRVESGERSVEHLPSSPQFPILDVSVPHSSFLIPPSLSSLPSFIGSALFSYLIAAMILGMGLLVAWAWKLPNYTQIAAQSVPHPMSHVPRPLTAMEFVGRITGMVECRWADPATAVPGPVAVPLGRKYALSAGLMEITYDTGARVILQGPCIYEVESAAGGFLSVGKLTARVDKKEERRTKKEERSGSNSPFLIPHSYFAVRTPTATVTDLGTEFGVEVGKSGATEAHVFVGIVEVARRHEGRALETIRLWANEAVHIDSATAPASRLHVSPGKFVTEMPRLEPRMAPVAWYKFDEVTGRMVLWTPDGSGHGRSATLREMSGASLVPGKIGNALKVNIDRDGQGALNQRVTLPWSPAFDMVGKSFTIALWLNRLAAGNEVHETIFHKEGNEGGYSIMRERDSGHLVFRIRKSSGRWVIIRTDTAGDDAPEDTWVHFAVVAEYRAATDTYDVRLYRNGVRVGGQDGVELATLPLPLSIGGLENGWAFRGLLDDVQVYHQALGDAETRFLFEHPGDNSPASLSNITEGR